MFAVLVFIALVVNVLGSITGKGDWWGELVTVLKEKVSNFVFRGLVTL